MWEVAASKGWTLAANRCGYPPDRLTRLRHGQARPVRRSRLGSRDGESQGTGRPSRRMRFGGYDRRTDKATSQSFPLIGTTFPGSPARRRFIEPQCSPRIGNPREGIRGIGKGDEGDEEIHPLISLLISLIPSLKKCLERTAGCDARIFSWNVLTSRCARRLATVEGVE